MNDPIALPITMADGATSTLLACNDTGLVPLSPIILMMPAMGVRASFYQRLAGPLATAGLRLITCDLRGHGLSSVRPSRTVDYGFCEMLEQDWPTAVNAVKEQFPGAAVTLLGHSLGGKLSLLFAAANPGAVNAVITVASCSIYWAGFPWAMRVPVLGFTQLVATSARVFGHYHGQRLGFAGNEARTMVADWAYQARTGRYRVTGSGINYDEALANTTTPALLISIARDAYAPHSAVDHLAGKLPAITVTRLHLDDQRLHAGRNVHFDWARTADPVIEAFTGWLDQQHTA